MTERMTDEEIAEVERLWRDAADKFRECFDSNVLQVHKRVLAVLVEAKRLRTLEAERVYVIRKGSSLGFTRDLLLNTVVAVTANERNAEPGAEVERLHELEAQLAQHPPPAPSGEPATPELATMFVRARAAQIGRQLDEAEHPKLVVGMVKPFEGVPTYTREEAIEKLGWDPYAGMVEDRSAVHVERLPGVGWDVGDAASEAERIISEGVEKRLGRLVPNAEKLLADVERLRAAELRWTSEKPKRDGWYWFRSEHMQYIRHVSASEVAELRLRESDGGEWAGPIEPPESTP